MTEHPDFQRLARLDRISRKMDTAFRIPVIGKRVGWDGILSIVPVVGDTLALAPSAFILYESRKLGLPAPKLAQQAVNVGIDYLIGSIPVLGTIFDIGFKSNRRNVKILEDHVHARHGRPKASPADGNLSSHHPGVR